MVISCISVIAWG